MLPPGRASHHSWHWCSSAPSCWPPAVPHSNLSILCRTSNLKAVCNLSHQCSPFQTSEPDRHTETTSAHLSQRLERGHSSPHWFLTSQDSWKQGLASQGWDVTVTEQEQITGLMQHGDVRGGLGSFGHAAQHSLIRQEICSKLPSLCFTVSCLGWRSFEVYLNYSGSFLFAHYEHVPVGVKTDEWWGMTLSCRNFSLYILSFFFFFFSYFIFCLQPAYKTEVYIWV